MQKYSCYKLLKRDLSKYLNISLLIYFKHGTLRNYEFLLDFTLTLQTKIPELFPVVIAIRPVRTKSYLCHFESEKKFMKQNYKDAAEKYFFFSLLENEKI